MGDEITIYNIKCPGTEVNSVLAGGGGGRWTPDSRLGAVGKVKSMSNPILRIRA